MIEIFGGAFALLMVLFVILNLLSSESQQTLAEHKPDETEYTISWEQEGSGYVILSFPGKLRIIETQETVLEKNVCRRDSPFVRYALKKYATENKQLIFSIVEGGVATMAKARNCLMHILPGRPISIGWIIANRELLKSVALDNIPPYIDKVLQK